jgi:hypothetical protein
MNSSRALHRYILRSLWAAAVLIAMVVLYLAMDQRVAELEFECMQRCDGRDLKYDYTPPGGGPPRENGQLRVPQVMRVHDALL